MGKMKFKVDKHLDKLAHVILYCVFLVGGMAVFLSRFSATRQFTIILLMVIFYLVWGLLYHYFRGDWTKKLTIEYLTIALIALLASLLIFIF